MHTLIIENKPRSVVFIIPEEMMPPNIMQFLPYLLPWLDSDHENENHIHNIDGIKIIENRAYILLPSGVSDKNSNTRAPKNRKRMKQ